MRKSCGLVLAGALLMLATAGSAADPPVDQAKKSQRGDPEAVFKRIDTNGDGKISKDEFKAFIEKASKGKKLNAELIEKLFGRLDTDGDGYLSLEEFKGLRELRERLVQKKNAKKGSAAGNPKE
jgi:hypothetical protein